MRKMIIRPNLRHAIKTFASDIFNDIQHLNWSLPAVKSSESSFVGKVQKLVSPDGGTLRPQVWDPEQLGKMPPQLAMFYAQHMAHFIEDELIDAISRIVKINRYGVQSLANDIKILSQKGLEVFELGSLARVRRYIELLTHVDEDESLFGLITESSNLRLKFSQVERLLIQRLKLQM